MKKIALPILLLISSVCFGQAVCIGTAAQCHDQKQFCAKEPALANLELLKATTVSGIVKLQTGFAFSGAGPTGPYWVQIRDSISGSVLRSVELNKDGKFEFGSIDKGSFRLIVVRKEGTDFKRPPLMDQPGGLKCGNASKCELDVVLKVHGTDNPIDFCPPK